MTAYHGGKQRIGRDIANVIYDVSTMIERESGFKIKGYCEPFCGMLGVYKHIPELFSSHKPKLNYKAGDINESVIEMWKEAQKGWIPQSSCSEIQYNSLKNYSGNNVNKMALRGYIGHQYSFGGKFFDCYAPKYGKTSDSTKASDNVVSIARNIKDVTFKNCSYSIFSRLKGYIIYCDPPYESSNSVYFSKDKRMSFNNNSFWDWCRHMSRYNILFISGYTAPKDFTCVFSCSHKLTGISCGNKEEKRRIEKLFIV
jgi:DNA adenine methylase